MTIQRALNDGSMRLGEAGIEEPRREARLLLMFALSCRIEDLTREPERLLGHRDQLIWNKALDLRSQRRPLPYITGEAWFYSRPFRVNRAVLIPRPETELLVEFVVEKAQELNGDFTVADIGTGSGCIAVTVALELQQVNVLAADISPLALLVARKNAQRHSVESKITLVNGDLLDPLRGQKVDMIVSNPPYISMAELPMLMPEVRIYEPSLALHQGAGEDGTLFHRRLLKESPGFLKMGGWLAMEVGHNQAKTVCSVAENCGYKAIEIRLDHAGIGRIIAVQWNG
jgi:release factor glutamine methyltransferase